MANNVNVTGFHHVAMKVRDITESLKLYTQVLGFPIFRQWSDAVKSGYLIDTGNGNYLELFSDGPKDGAPRPDGCWVHLALRCTDTKSAIEKVRQAGYTVTMECTDVTIASNPPYPVRIAFFKGPDGELVEFFETL